MDATIEHKHSEAPKKTFKKSYWRRLRLSLKYRPEIMKLILKMKSTIHRKNAIISKLKYQFKLLANNKASDNKTDNSILIKSEIENLKETVPSDDVQSQIKENVDLKNCESNSEVPDGNKKNKSFETMQVDLPKKEFKDSFTQTEDKIKNGPQTERDRDSEEKGWRTDNGEKEKSIADQVKEVAQNALQQSGMVYVESAGMYYDYKTGYYYNSELGLYYHTDTGCYYYYSDEKQSFVFHSYPDRSKIITNPALEAHRKKKARKQKRDMKSEDDVENLTKNLSQDKEEDSTEKASKPKRRKVSKKNKEETKSAPSEDKDEAQIVLEDKAPDKTETEGIFSAPEIETAKEDGKKSSEDLEDGECSETDSEKSDGEKSDGEKSGGDSDGGESDGSTSTATDDESVAKHHPPCMRIIVRETNLPKLKVGTLFLVTKDGGTVGREGDQHTIIIRDHNVSRNHLDIKYDESKRMYVATDLGSKNGTILNGIRMCESQIISEPLEIIHGSTLQLGETKLLCHIHPGNDTCGHCEPGLLLETHDKEKTVAYTRTCSVQKQYQLELARLKNKYAPQPLAIEETAYNDRAQIRRDTVGSSHHSEKTQSSDVDTFIAPENKGFKLLEKMGWSKGEGLGKDSQGDTEPVPLVSNEGKSGLGAPNLPPAAVKKANSLGSATIRLASRSKLLKPPAKAFQTPLDEDSDE